MRTKDLIAKRMRRERAHLRKERTNKQNLYSHKNPKQRENIPSQRDLHRKY